jgi:hypothetical protein
MSSDAAMQPCNMHAWINLFYLVLVAWCTQPVGQSNATIALHEHDQVVQLDEDWGWSVSLTTTARAAWTALDHVRRLTNKQIRIGITMTVPEMPASTTEYKASGELEATTAISPHEISSRLQQRSSTYKHKRCLPQVLPRVPIETSIRREAKMSEAHEEVGIDLLTPNTELLCGAWRGWELADDWRAMQFASAELDYSLTIQTGNVVSSSICIQTVRWRPTA